jgi:hypothetical protein
MMYHRIGKHALQSILAALREDRFALFQHGRTGHSGLSYSNGVKNRKRVRKFLKRFAHVHGLPMPGGLTCSTVVLLPSEMSILSIYNVFRENDSSDMSYETFRLTWSKSCPRIRIMSKATDVCETCFYRKQAIRSPSSDIRGVLTEWQQHRDIAAAARKLYKETCLQLKRKWLFLPPTTRRDLRARRNVSMEQSPVESMVYSFDFAQNVYLPFSSQQPGPVYFKSMFQV